MTQNENTVESTGFLDSKFGKTLMIILSVILIFAGPTYIIYGLAVVLGVNLMASFIVGLSLLIVGLIMMMYLVRKKIIT